MKRLLGVMLVVLGLGGIALGAEAWTRSTIANRITAGAEEYLGVTPDVTLHGGLVLPQVISGTLQRVDVTAPRVSYAGFTVVDVRGTASGIETRDPYTADRIRLSARVTTEELNRLYGEVSPIGGEITSQNGTVGLQGQVLGQTLGIAFDLTVTEGAIHLNPNEVYLNNDRADISVLAMILTGIDQEIRIPVDLPQGLRLQSAAVRDNGIVLDVRGENLVLTDLQP
nr:DUF2993 domain-containing protein [Actinomycetales bacterium]